MVASTVQRTLVRHIRHDERDRPGGLVHVDVPPRRTGLPRHGVPAIDRVTTDNALAYRRSHAFRTALAEIGASQRFTRVDNLTRHYS